MNTEWNLSIIYSGLDDPALQEDMNKLSQANESLKAAVEKASGLNDKDKAELILTELESYNKILMKIFDFLQLRQACNTEDGQNMALINKAMSIYNAGAEYTVAADRILGSIENVDALAEESDIIKEYSFLIKETKKRCSHLLSNEVEAMISAMNMTGGGAWGDLQSYLTSTVKVDYDGRQVTLSEIRNLAYSSDSNVRRAAYDAELKCYEKIADSVAFSLNNIKNQVTMLSAKKGYESPLAMTLENSRMSRQTLDSMMEAVEEYLPVFRKYLRKKGELLGCKNGLPWYELFAPLGKSDKKYSLEEARDYLTTCFNEFTPDMADMMKEAFDNEWIDFYPRNGKQGGAFCASLTGYKQSRILTNYDGSFGAIDTLAHELGHAFHNRTMEGQRILNSDYPMPVAETASTFNEVHLGHYALSKASNDEEKLALLENDLKEKAQCVVDIYSRYLFETAVFEQSQEKFLMTSDLNEIMLDCQKKAYGDGLDPEYMHPYMWVCKSHYYSSGISFYNFPYTFGNLFAQGLYNLYCEQGDAFVARYKEMLRLTPVHTIEEDGAMLGIDLTKKDFWEASLKSIAEEIEEFCRL